MRQENTSRLFDYWNALRGDRSAPERSEIEPGDIREILGDTFILEISMQLRAVSFRLAGTRLCSVYGRELKGLGFLALWDEENNFEVAKAVRRVYQDHTPVLASYLAATAEARFVEYEMILLPLMPISDGNARILGLAAPRTIPYWLGADPLVVNRLRHMRAIELPPVTTPPLAFDADPNAPSPRQGRPGRPRRVAHLTVLEGGRDQD